MTEDERPGLDRPGTIPVADFEAAPRMTEDEWHDSDDVPRMLETLREIHRGDHATLERKLQEYYVACCRSIWKLLPDKGSRRGIKVAERFLEGTAKNEHLVAIDGISEASAFLFDYGDEDDPTILRYVEQVRAIPEAEFRAMIHQPGAISELSTRDLLTWAAYFASFAIFPPEIRRSLPDIYRPFLSPTLLREQFGGIDWRIDEH